MVFSFYSHHGQSKEDLKLQTGIQMLRTLTTYRVTGWKEREKPANRRVVKRLSSCDRMCRWQWPREEVERVISPCWRGKRRQKVPPAIKPSNSDGSVLLRKTELTTRITRNRPLKSICAWLGDLRDEKSRAGIRWLSSCPPGLFLIFKNYVYILLC